METTVDTSTVHPSPTMNLTLLSPRSITPLTNRSPLVKSSFMPSATPMVSRRSSLLTPMATRTLTFSTASFQERLRVFLCLFNRS